MEDQNNTSEGRGADKDKRHECGRWRSPIIRDKNDDAIGATVFLTAEDLVELGINPESAGEILYRIDKGETIRVIENDGG